MSSTTEKQIDKDFFIKGYKDYCNRVGAAPGSAYRLCRFLFVSETDFYHQFENLKSLKKAIFANLLNDTFDNLNHSKEFLEYSARERLLAFHYTLIENLKPHFNFIKIAFQPIRWQLFINYQLDALKESYLPFAQDLLNYAFETEEISKRAVIDNYYEQALYLQLIFVLNYFSQDTSQEWANTDAAIEKSTHLVFDLLHKNAADATVDFGKFLLQNKL